MSATKMEPAAISPAANSEITEELLESLYSGGLDAILETAYSVLGNPVFIRDVSHKLLGITKNIIIDHPFIRELIETGSFDETTVKKMKQFNRFNAAQLHGTSCAPVLINFETDKPNLITGPVLIGNTVVAFVSVVEHCRPFVKDDFAIIAKLCKVVSIQLQKSNTFTMSGGTQHEYFLLDLLEKNSKTSQNQLFIEQRLKNLSIKLKSNLFVVAFRVEKNLKSETELQTIAKELRQLLIGSITAVYCNHIIMLMSSDTSQPLSPFQKTSLDGFLEINSIIAAFSQCFTDITKTYKYYIQAVESIEIGKNIKVDERLFFSEELLVYYIFRLGDKAIDLTDYIHPTMLRLRDYDNDNNTELFKTLYYYITHLKNAAHTLEHLHIHRNTLLYRLHKIEEIMEIDLNNSEVGFHILISFKILEYSARETGREICFR